MSKFVEKKKKEQTKKTKFIHTDNLKINIKFICFELILLLLFFFFCLFLRLHRQCFLFILYMFLFALF